MQKLTKDTLFILLPGVISLLKAEAFRLVAGALNVLSFAFRGRVFNSARWCTNGPGKLLYLLL
jgi:hypothetical protein